MIANTWNGISRVIDDAARRLSSSAVPVLLRMPDGDTVRMAVKSADVIPTDDGLALSVELADPEDDGYLGLNIRAMGRAAYMLAANLAASENFSKKSSSVLDAEVGDMIQYGAKS